MTFGAFGSGVGGCAFTDTSAPIATSTPSTIVRFIRLPNQQSVIRNQQLFQFVVDRRDRGLIAIFLVALVLRREVDRLGGLLRTLAFRLRLARGLDEIGHELL